MSRPQYDERVPAAPFVAWLNQQCEQEDQEIIAARAGVATRTIYRWKNSLDATTSEPTDNYARMVVEDILHRADVPFDDIYPELAKVDEVELAPEAYCSSCHDVVTPIDGQCPWCDRPVRLDVPLRMYCRREKATRFPALDGNCWRCGGNLVKYPPTKQCACGCGKAIPGFNMRSGRPNTYVLGHQPRWQDSQADVPAGPFAEYLERELQALDPIQSLARRMKLSREELLDLLNRRVATVNRATVRRALMSAAIEGQGFRLVQQRPGSTLITDLYPNPPCPGCGAEKSPKAKLCKPCRRKAGPDNPNRPKSLTEPLLEEARALYDSGATYHQIAHAIQGRTRCTNVAGLRVALITEFNRRGWSRGHRHPSELRNAA